MVKMDFEYLGNLKVKAVHQLSGAEMNTAAPLDNKGDGSSFSPTDMLATATCTCMLTLMGIHANKHSIDISGTRASVEKHMTNNPRRVEKLVIDVHIPHDIDQNGRQILYDAAINCPVAKSIHPDLEINLTMTYDD